MVEIIYDAQINEIMHDRVLCLQAIIIIQSIPWNIPDQESKNNSLYQSMVQISSCKHQLSNHCQ